jgi:hypothetical protein
MRSTLSEYLRNLDKERRLRFLAYLALNLGVAARAEYPRASHQGEGEGGRLRAFNEMYQEIARQLIGELDSSEHKPLDVAVGDSLRNHAADNRLVDALDWAINKAVEMVDRR